MAALVAARARQGLGAGAIPALAYVAIGHAYPTELQARMFAVISTAWVLPAVVGPAISGAVADAVGWRWVFLGLLPLVVARGRDHDAGAARARRAGRRRTGRQARSTPCVLAARRRARARGHVGGDRSSSAAVPLVSSAR